MIKPYVIDAFIKEGKSRKPFHLHVSAPKKTDGEEDYYCLVHAPMLFKNDKIIVGVSEKQARDLALQFVKKILGDKKLIDKNGQDVQI